MRIPKKPSERRGCRRVQKRNPPPTPEEWAAAEVAKSPDLGERQARDLLRILGLDGDMDG